MEKLNPLSVLSPSAQQRYARVVAAQARGLRVGAALAEAGVPQRTWGNWRWRLGLPPGRRGPRRFSPVCRRRLRALGLLAAGLTYKAAAKRIGLSLCRLTCLVTYGLPPVAGPCALCGAPAILHHHLLYVPEIVLPVCRSCHLSKCHRYQNRKAHREH